MTFPFDFERGILNIGFILSGLVACVALCHAQNTCAQIFFEENDIVVSGDKFFHGHNNRHGRVITFAT